MWARLYVAGRTIFYFIKQHHAYDCHDDHASDGKEQIVAHANLVS
jgi:hypothetical protein